MYSIFVFHCLYQLFLLYRLINLDTQRDKNISVYKYYSVRYLYIMAEGRMKTIDI